MTTRERPRGAGVYHHGNLRQALLDAGLELAREGGADAVVLREATRRAGVTANAAYRHFSGRDALVEAVSAAALGQLAHAMEERIAAEQASLTVSEGAIRTLSSPGDEPVSTRGVRDDALERALALSRLRAVGASYIAFAVCEPGWFDAAFFAVSDMSRAEAAEAMGPGGRSPFHLLGDALEDLVRVGVLRPAQRAGAEVFCWSAVHGYAVLATRGPLRAFDEATVGALADRVVDLAIAGVSTTTPPAAPGDR